MKKALLAIPLVLMLGACTDETYTQEQGIVVGKEVDGGRYGDSYLIQVAYPASGGKYAMDYVDVGSQSAYDGYRIKDKVTVYENNDGISQITK